MNFSFVSDTAFSQFAFQNTNPFHYRHVMFHYWHVMRHVTRSTRTCLAILGADKTCFFYVLWRHNGSHLWRSVITAINHLIRVNMPWMPALLSSCRRLWSSETKGLNVATLEQLKERRKMEMKRNSRRIKKNPICLNYIYKWCVSKKVSTCSSKQSTR